MQAFADQFVKNFGIVVTTILALLVIVSPLAGLITSALVTSGVIAADSKWAVLVAKLCSFSLYAQSGRPAKPTSDAAKTTLASLLVLLLLVDCSHEAARSRRIATQHDGGRMAVPAPARPDAECRTLDTIHVYGDWSAGVMGAVGTGAGIVASSTDDGARKAAIWTGVGAAAVAAVAVGIAEQSASSWTERCGQ